MISWLNAYRQPDIFIWLTTRIYLSLIVIAMTGKFQFWFLLEIYILLLFCFVDF